MGLLDLFASLRPSTRSTRHWPSSPSRASKSLAASDNGSSPMSRCFDLFGRAIMRTPAAACRTAVGPRVPKQDCTSCQGTSRPDRPPSKLSRARKRLVSLTSMLAGSKPTRPAAARSVNGTAVGSRARVWCAPISGVGRASEIRGATATDADQAATLAR